MVGQSLESAGLARDARWRWTPAKGRWGGPPEVRRAGGRPKLAAVAGRRRRGRQEEEAPVEAGGAAGAGPAGTRGVDRREDLAAACRRRGWRVDKDEWRKEKKMVRKKKKRKKWAIWTFYNLNVTNEAVLPNIF